MTLGEGWAVALVGFGRDPFFVPTTWLGGGGGAAGGAGLRQRQALLLGCCRREKAQEKATRSMAERSGSEGALLLRGRGRGGREEETNDLVGFREVDDREDGNARAAASHTVTGRDWTGHWTGWPLDKDTGTQARMGQDLLCCPRG